MYGKSPDIGTRIKHGAVAAVIGGGLGIGTVHQLNQPPEPSTLPFHRNIEGMAGSNPFCRASAVEIGKIMGSEDADKIADKTWGAVTNVFKGDFVKRESLKLDPFNVFCTPNLNRTTARIEGVFEGDTPQIGVSFAANFENNPQGQESKEETIELTKPINDSKKLGQKESVRKMHTIGIEFPRTFDAEVKYFMGRSVDSSDPEQMRGRIKELEDISRKLLNIPDDQPFIPDRNATGFTTYANDHTTGYGLYVTTDGDISGYTAAIRVHEGLSGDKDSWKEVGSRHGIDPTKVSYDTLLKKAVEDLDRENNIRRIFKRPPCEESGTIYRLAGKNEAADYFAQQAQNRPPASPTNPDAGLTKP